MVISNSKTAQLLKSELGMVFMLTMMQLKEILLYLTMLYIKWGGVQSIELVDKV